MVKRISFFLGVLWLASTCLLAQQHDFQVTKFHLETGTYQFSQGLVPFWFRANQYGTVPTYPPGAVIRGGLHADYHPTFTKKKPIDLAYGLDAVLNLAGQQRQFLLPEAYVKIRLWPFELYGGRRREVVGLVDTLLTSGSYIWSGSALPVPKMQLSIPDYWPAKGWLAIKGTFAHGFFEKSRPYVNNALLHQKSVYVRFGKPSWKVRLQGGFNHQVMWGGSSPFFSKDGTLPSSQQAFWYVLTGRSVAGDSTKFRNSFDGGNRVGNHLGTIDAALDLRLGGSALFFYRQSIYEDGSLYYLINLGDGLNGVSWQNRREVWPRFRLNRVTLEYLSTWSQGGAAFGDDPRQRGRDNYFNHQQYRDGWSYEGRTLGTPFIAPTGELANAATNPVGGGFTSNNRVRVFHLGLDGNFGLSSRFEGRVSYSRNAGTYDVPFTPERTQFSSYLRCTTDLDFMAGTELSGALAWDRGGLLDNAFGLHLRLRKIWDNEAWLLARAERRDARRAKREAPALMTPRNLK